MQPRSVEKLEESEDESGKVPGLSALFSACILMDAYLVVSVRQSRLSYLELEFSCKYFFYILLD